MRTKHYLLTLLILTILFGCGKKRVPFFELKKENAVWYYEGQLFNGIAFQMWDGTVVKEQATMKNGEIHGARKTWYRNGQLRSEWDYKHGKKHGVLRLWHDNGQLQSESHSVDDLGQGVTKEWYENGQLMIESYQKDSNVTGLYKQWHNNGQLAREAKYDFGGVIQGTEKKWDKNGKSIP